MVYYITIDIQILIFLFLLLTSIYSVTIIYISYNSIIFLDNLFKISSVTKEDDANLNTEIKNAVAAADDKAQYDE